MNYITNFHKSREAKIGASDIPWLIPSPNRPIESLAAFTNSKGQREHCTALDLYNEKINPSPWEYNFSADMGHFLESKALYEFISDNIDRDVATEFMRGYQLHKIETTQRNNMKTGKSLYGCVNPEPFNNTPFKHNTEALNDYGVAHADCVYLPFETHQASGGQSYEKHDKSLLNNLQSKNINMKQDKNGDWIIDINGLKINMSKPFIIEAKSARSHTVYTRKHDIYKGYDLSLKSWQGIPLKVYMQIQFQMLLYNIDIAYVALIFDTSEKHYWQIEANRKHQSDLIQLSSYMKTCIDTKTKPKELVMNSKDIKNLYPDVIDDFREVKNTEDKNELDEVLQIAIDHKSAKKKEKLWKNEKEDCEQRMSIHLKDTETIKGKVNGVVTEIATWKKTGGAEYIEGIGGIKKRDDAKTILNYFKKKGLIKTQNVSTKSTISIKSKELEGVEI